MQYIWQWERIDTRLTSQFPYSRSFFHHIISRWWVTIQIKNWDEIKQKIIKKSYKLKNWDEIIIDNLERYLSPIILEEAPNIEIPIVLEEDDYLIINKPKWVLSHPNSVWDADQPSVVWFLYHNFKNLPSIWNFIRAWLVHRLDKDTNWLMIIAKSEKWLAHFKELFKAKSESEKINDKENAAIKKFYRATSIITVLWQEFLNKIENNLPYYIEEVVNAKTPNPTPKMWITKILKIIKLDNDELNLKLEILTGRTHQIRYHLSNHWLPIVWDYLYGTEEERKMQLTAYKLEFTDPNWKKIKLEI